MQPKPAGGPAVVESTTRTAHIIVYGLALFADEYQFYVQDDGAHGDTASRDFRSDRALKRPGDIVAKRPL